MREAVATLAPSFLANPKGFAQWMRIMMGVYGDACDKVGAEIDVKLVGPIRDVLEDMPA